MVPSDASRAMTGSARPLLVLVDGSSYLYRAFHALPSLTNSSGEPTGAVLGVTNMLQRLIKDHDPQYIAVVFDAKGKTFRDEIYPEYKATRPPMPDELRDQIQPIHEIVRALGLPLLQIGGVEADDVIGTLAAEASANNMDTLVSTGDKDLAQLVDAHTTLVNTMSGEVLDPAGVVKKFGVTPEQIVDYLGLVGDKSDNIPGVPKVGPKTATKWLGEYGSAEELATRADEIQGKVGESLRENLKNLALSKQLATIARDVKLDDRPGELKRHGADYKRLRELYTALGFSSLLRNLPDDANEPSAAEVHTASGDYQIVLTKKEFDAWFRRLEQAPLIAFDTETTSLEYMNAEIVGVSFATESGSAAYVPLAHAYPGAPEQLNRDEILARLKPLLEDADRPKLGHHLKYDAHVLRNHGIVLRGLKFDSMLESYVVDSTATRHDMDSVARRYLGRETVHYEDIAGKGAKQLRFDEIDINVAGPYAAEDADITFQIHAALWPKIEEVPELAKLYTEIEQPLVGVLADMEYRGVLIDVDMLERQSADLAKLMDKLQAEAHCEAGGPFNLGSPRQLQEILFDQLGLPVIRKTPKGQPSTAEDVLAELALDYPLPQLILDFRSLSKLKSTYTDRLPEQVNARTGRVHTSYHQAVAATGRLSSSDPNLQNIPVRTPEGRRIRQAFIAPPGFSLLAADYSQIELRIMAHLSGDEGLTEAFAADRDIHQATAAEVFGEELAAVTPDQRRSAKAINFGLIYGMSAFGLARQLGITRKSAQEYVNLYFERYPGVKAYMARTRKQAKEQGYVETVLGRRLYLPEINARNAARRQYSERSAINAPMQGTAADIIKLAMIAIHSLLSETGSKSRLIMQVHDELILEVAADEIGPVTEKVVELMSGALPLAVPLKVDTGLGQNWDEAH